MVGAAFDPLQRGRGMAHCCHAMRNTYWIFSAMREICQRAVEGLFIPVSVHEMCHFMRLPTCQPCPDPTSTTSSRYPRIIVKPML